MKFKNAIFFGILTMIVVGGINFVSIFLNTGIILWRDVLWKSFLTGFGVGAAIYISIQAFQIVGQSGGSAPATGGMHSADKNIDFTDEKINPGEMNEEEEAAEEATEMASQTKSPEESSSVTPGENNTQPSSEDMGEEEDSMESEDAEEIADLISETIDEEE